MCARYTLRQDILDQHPSFTTDAQRLALEHHYRRIYAAHPDADALFSSRDFLVWVSQSTERKAALSGGGTGEIIAMFSAYKAQLPDWERGVISPPPSR
jgi:hypothetical protein